MARPKRQRQYRDGFIQTSRGEWAFISPEDQELDQLDWHSHNQYVYRFEYPDGQRKRRIALHREILRRTTGSTVPSAIHVDHINRNPLDNRRENLREATPLVNGGNVVKAIRGVTGYKGVALSRNKQKYECLIRYGVQIYIGVFSTPEEAAWMYDQYAVALRGEPTVLNFEYV